MIFEKEIYKILDVYGKLAGVIDIPRFSDRQVINKIKQQIETVIDEVMPEVKTSQSRQPGKYHNFMRDKLFRRFNIK